MLAEIKDPGDLVAARRDGENSLYVEGLVQRVYEEEGSYFYQIAWEDGANFGDMFSEDDLDEIDLVESEALLRAGLSDFIDEESMDLWMELPNERLNGLDPYDALALLGLKEVTEAALFDLAKSIEEEEAAKNEELPAEDSKENEESSLYL